MPGDPVTEALHHQVGRRLVGRVRDLVEADQVHAALQTAQQTDQGVGVCDGIVHAGEHRIFETHAPLTRKIVLPQQVDNIGDRPGFLDGHQGGAFLRERIVQAHGDVAAGTVQETPECRQHPDGGDGDPLRAPCKTPGGRHHLDGTQQVLLVVERFAHPHEDGVGQVGGLVDGDKLRQDIGGGEVPVEPLPSGHAEGAAHPAAGLRRDTERPAVFIGNHHGLHRALFQFGRAALHVGVQPRCAGTGDREKVLLRPVAGNLAAGRQRDAEVEGRGKLLATGLGDVGHFRERPCAAGVQPARELPAGEGGKADGKGGFLQLNGGHSQEFRSHIRTFLFSMQK